VMSPCSPLKVRANQVMGCIEQCVNGGECPAANRPINDVGTPLARRRFDFMVSALWSPLFSKSLPPCVKALH
ncbi:hypothetical protein, partial [Xanthomonas oryzae]